MDEGKKSTTTQLGDFSNDRIERLLAEGRAALRRSEEARASSLRLPPAELTEEQRGSEGAIHSKNNNEEAHPVPLVSRAPKPPSPIRHGSWRPPELIKQPRKLPTDYPDTLSLRTLAVINEAREKEKFPRRSQLLDFCKQVLANLTPDFYGEVQAARLQGPQALSHLDELLDSLLFYNEKIESAQDNLRQELKRSKEWAAFIRELSRAEQQALGSPQSSGAGAATWDTIEISFLSDERVQIRNGKTYNYAELGFEDSRNRKPNQAWVTLRDLAEGKGIILIDARRVLPWPKVEKRIQEIRKALRHHFGISSDPFLFKEGIGYQARFKIGLSPSFRT